MKEKNILSHGLKDFSPKMVDAFALALTVVKGWKEYVLEKVKESTAAYKGLPLVI